MELKFNFDDPSYVYITNRDDALKAISVLSNGQMISVDVEAGGLDPLSNKLLLVQLANESTSYIFDAQKFKLKDFEPLISLLENPKILKIMHNGKFDYQFIKVHVGAKVKNIFDTMLAEGVLSAGLKRPQTLASLSEEYLGTRLDKSLRKSFEELKTQITKEQLKYAALDTLVLFPIFEAQTKKLKQEGLINIAKLEFAVMPVVAEMELYGIYIDVDRWRDILESLKKKHQEYLQKFQEAVRPYYQSSQIDLFGNHSEVINTDSNVQLLDLFNNKLHLNVPSTGDEVLMSLSHPIAKILREYRAYAKLISAFGENLLSKVNPKTGRIHPDFIQLGAATGRFACSNPNLQQVPRNSEEAPFRQCFKPAPGYKLVVTDYSAFEMRILADLSGDEKMIEALKNGLDIHSYTASLMFGKEYTPDFKKLYPELRQIAKPIGFGLMYGMGPMGLAKRLEPELGREVSKEEATDYMNKYFGAYPKVKIFLEKAANQAVQRGWSTTPAGRKRWYKIPETTDPEYKKKIAQIQREAKNHPIQGTNADVIKYALVFVHERMKKEGVEGSITHTVHDELVTEVREDQAEEWAKCQQQEMIRAGELILKKVPVVSDPVVSDVWEH